MHICICAGDGCQRKTLEEYIRKYSARKFAVLISELNNAEELIAYYSAGKRFDIVFLELEPNGKCGLQAAEFIRKTDKNAIIILVSCCQRYVFEAFRVEALHFMLKPIREAEFKSAFERAVQKYNTVNSSVILSSQNDRYVIKINTIQYIEGYNRHITVFTTDGEYKAVGKLTDILLRLEPHGFIRIHQGYIVNMNCIKRFNTDNVVLADGTTVMMSQRKRAASLKAFDLYLKSIKP